MSGLVLQAVIILIVATGSRTQPQDTCQGLDTLISNRTVTFTGTCTRNDRCNEISCSNPIDMMEGILNATYSFDYCSYNTTTLTIYLIQTGMNPFESNTSTGGSKIIPVGTQSANLTLISSDDGVTFGVYNSGGVLFQDTFIPYPPECSCPRLSLTNGAVTYSNNLLIRSVANYTCDATNGYVLAPGSPTNRTCTMNGWTGVNATCELFDCKMTDLQNPDNGEFTLATGTTTFGSMVTFKCNDKYQLKGVSTRTCGLNGWSNENPTCERKDGATNRLSTGIIAVVVIVVVCFVACLILGVIVSLIVGYKCREKKKRLKAYTRRQNRM